MNDDTYNAPYRRPNWSRVNQWLLWVGLAAAVIWLVTKHGAHLLEIAPFLFILACPLMHVRTRGDGHVSHGKSNHHAAEDMNGELPRRDP